MDYDLWWHLKTGEIIWLWKQIPAFDIFSYSAPGAPWVNHEWLFQVIAWLSYNNLGIASMTGFKLLFTGLIALVAFRTFKLFSGSNSASLWGTLVLIWITADRILERPHLFSIFFIMYFCLRLHQFVAGKRNNLWELPLIQMAWVNIHGGGIFGPQMLVAFTFGEWLMGRFDIGMALPRERMRHLILITFACIAAALINPSGIDILLFSAGHLQMKTILAHTQEWLPVLDPRLDWIISMFMLRVVIVTTLLSYIVNRKKARLSHLFLTVLTGLLILNGKRFAPDFIIVNMPLIYYNLRDFAKQIPISKNAGHLHAWGNILAIFLISTTVARDGLPVTLKGERASPMGIGTIEEYTPSAMIDFLDEEDIHGRVFNEMALGGYLIFRRWPRDLVFLDGRTPVYGDDFYREFIDSFYLSQNFDKLDRRYQFDYIVFRAGTAREIYNFHKYIWENPDWRLIYANSAEGLVYVRNLPKFKKQIEKLAFKRNPLIEAVECERKRGVD